MNLFILFLLILIIPVSAIVLGLFSMLKIIYTKANYQNLEDYAQARVAPLINKINKQSYMLKKLDDNLKQEPAIVVTKNGILIHEHKIKNLSDNALISGLLYQYCEQFLENLGI